MKIVIDTHSLFWFTTNNKNLSKRARFTIRRAVKVFIPTIVLMELFYLMKKNKLRDRFLEIFARIKNTKKYSIISLDLGIAEKVFQAKYNLEIHDNIIMITAHELGLPLVTKDPQIQKVYKNVIW